MIKVKSIFISTDTEEPVEEILEFPNYEEVMRHMKAFNGEWVVTFYNNEDRKVDMRIITLSDFEEI